MGAKVRSCLEMSETRVLRVADVIRGLVVGFCVCVCVCVCVRACVLGVFWIKKEEIAVRVARKAKSGMDVHRSIPKV